MKKVQEYRMINYEQTLVNELNVTNETIRSCEEIIKLTKERIKLEKKALLLIQKQLAEIIK